MSLIIGISLCHKLSMSVGFAGSNVDFVNLLVERTFFHYPILSLFFYC